MKKKNLKKYINENGFFFHVQGERIERNEFEACRDTNAIKTGAKAPTGENIIFFRGTATQQFDKAEVNRNGYKIDVKGWDWKNYKKNPIILWQHIDDQPIGKTLEILPHENGVDVIYYIDLKTLDDKDAHRIDSGLVSMLSTGHLTKEVMFENKDTGAMVDENQFWSLPFDERENYNRVVTKAEAVEISAVTIGSNPDALTVKNALELFFNNLTMKKKINSEEDEKAESTENVDDVSDTTEETTDEAVEDEKSDAATDEAENAEKVAEDAEAKADEAGDDAKADDKIVISKEDRLRLEETARVLNSVLESTIVKDEVVKKKDDKVETKEDSVNVADMFDVVGNAIVALAGVIEKYENKIKGFEAKLDAIPVKKGLSINSQFNEDSEAGKNAEEKKESNGTALINFLQNRGVKIQPKEDSK